MVDAAELTFLAQSSLGGEAAWYTDSGVCDGGALRGHRGRARNAGLGPGEKMTEGNLSQDFKDEWELARQGVGAGMFWRE